jgi:hypothetical protein
MSPTQVIVIGAALVIVFDTIAALLSRAAGLSYTRFVIGSWSIYALVGYFAARSAHGGPVEAALLAGVVLGATDCTLGWAISWFIGPGKVNDRVTPTRWAAIAVIGTATAATIAALAGLLA